MKKEQKLTPLTFKEAFSILHPLANIIEKEMTQGCIVRDFYKYDMETISEMEKEFFPVLFRIGTYGASTVMPVARGMEMMEGERARYEYAQRPVDYYMRDCKENREARWFMLQPNDKNKDGVTEINFEEAKRTYRRLLLPYLITVKPLLPKRFKKKIRFHNITLSRLKELLSDSRKIEKRWSNDPETVGENLLAILKQKQKEIQLGSDHHYDIYWNEKWHEFSFCEGGIEGHCLNGAIVYHGCPEDGYKENGSVQLTPCYGWSSHT